MTARDPEYRELQHPREARRRSSGRRVQIVGYWINPCTGQRLAAVVHERVTVLNLADLEDHLEPELPARAGLSALTPLEA